MPPIEDNVMVGGFRYTALPTDPITLALLRLGEFPKSMERVRGLTKNQKAGNLKVEGKIMQETIRKWTPRAMTTKALRLALRVVSQHPTDQDIAMGAELLERGYRKQHNFKIYTRRFRRAHGLV